MVYGFTVFEKDFADGWIVREFTSNMEKAFMALGSIMNEGKAVRLECTMEVADDVSDLREA